MRVPRLRLGLLAVASGIALCGCAYDMYGDGYGGGYGYGPYSGVSVGIGYGGGYGGYYGGYGDYGYGGYGYDPFGWYGDYYYPGAGIYVYDRHRNRHQWTDTQRRYWEDRRNRWQSHNGSTGTNSTQNWSGWDRSHWRDRNNSTSPVTTTTGNRSNWQSRSSVTNRGERVRSSDGEHHSRERSNERPN